VTIDSSQTAIDEYRQGRREHHPRPPKALEINHIQQATLNGRPIKAGSG